MKLRKLKRTDGSLISIIIFTFLAFLSVLYFTNASYSNWHFSTTGQIGDTIGGLTAPVIGLLNAVLLFITLKRQDEQRNEDKFNRKFEKRTDRIKTLIDSLQFNLYFKTIHSSDPIKVGQFYGYSSLLVFSSLLTIENENKLDMYEMGLSEWGSFVQNLSKILTEAEQALSENHVSTIDNEEKLSNFLFINYELTNIKSLFSLVEKYITKHPEHPGTAKFSLIMLNDDLKLKIKNLDTYRPAF